MTPESHSIQDSQEGDEELLADEIVLSFDADADADSDNILLEKFSPPRLVPPEEEEEQTPENYFDTPQDESLPTPTFLLQPPDPAVTGKPIPWILGIRFGKSCMTFRIHATLPDVRVGEPLLLETKDGDAIGWVVFATPRIPERNYSPPYPGKILSVRRRLSQWERDNVRNNHEKEQKTKQICWQLVDELKLEMRISRVEFSLDGNKAIIFFTAENRVDFRELVKLLAKEIRARVELRQIGVRDETRLLGGLGPCGRVFCCSMFLTEFRPVSVRMAKNQDLSLNPESISGLCGRLMCCLSYENDAYLELRKNLPKLNSRFLNKEGIEVVVRAVHPMTNSMEVQLPTGEKVKATLEELTPLGESPLEKTPPVEAPPPQPRERTPRRAPPRSQPPVESVALPSPVRPIVPAPTPPVPRQENRGVPRRGPRRPMETTARTEVAPVPVPPVEKTTPPAEERTVNRRRRFHRRPPGGQGNPPPAASS